MIVGTIASPSNPSVRFTAFELPSITSIANTGKNQPSGISTSLNTGTVNPVDNGSRVSRVIHTAAPKPNTTWHTSLPRADTPLGLRRDSLR